MTLQEMEEIAQANIERNLNIVEGYDSWFEAADAIFDEAYTLALDALIDAGVNILKARSVANQVACRYAVP